MQKTSLIVLLFIFSSCLPFEKKGRLNFSTKITNQENVQSLPNDTDTQPELVNFEILKTKIIVPHCLDCHKKYVNEERILRDIVPGKPDDSLFFLVLKDGSMPEESPPLNTQELEIVQNYIENLKLQ
jgi:hypothetical protein